MKRLLLLALVVAAGCKANPASVQISLAMEQNASTPTDLKISVYDIHGRIIDAKPMGDPPTLPGDLTVLVDDDAQVVRVFAWGNAANGRTIWAAGRVDISPATQSRLELQLGESTPPDLDGDGVPDPIDNCPGKSNGDQASIGGGAKGDACNNSGGGMGDGGNMNGGDVDMSTGGGKDGGVVTASCGDGTVNAGEDCDDGAKNSDDPALTTAKCTTGCRVRAGCGPLTGAAAAAIDPASGHCYVAWAGPLNWTSSQRECLRNGGDLVSITSQAENDVIKNLVGGTAWIGYVAAPGTTTFKWVDGSNSTFNGFAPGEPKNTGECARTGVDGWHADNCGMPSNGQFPLNLANKLPYVCESACGNGKIDPGETCDPPGPTCTKTCQKIAACTESGGMTLAENGHCYFKTSSTVSYNNALNKACAVGTHLATTDTPAETDIGLLVAGNDDIWIALSAKQTLAVFQWDILNDAIFNARRYHAFGDNDPNQDPPAGTVLTNLPPAGPVGWRDRNINTDNYKSLCERDQ